MKDPGDATALRQELFRLEDTRHALANRAQRILLALALTLDVEALTQLRLEAVDTSASDGVAQLEAAAQRCRAMMREIGGGPDLL